MNASLQALKKKEKTKSKLVNIKEAAYPFMKKGYAVYNMYKVFYIQELRQHEHEISHSRLTTRRR